MAKHWVLALVHREGDAFGIHFPDYPGAISGGSSFEDAVNRGANTLSFHLRGLAEDGEEIREPAGQDEALKRAMPEIRKGAMPALIEVEFPGRSVRINVSIEESLLVQIDRAAVAAGESRSSFLATAARNRMMG